MDDRHGKLTDDRLDDLVRRATLAGPTVESEPSGGLPLLTRVLLASGVLAAAGLAIAVTVTISSRPTPNSGAVDRIAEATEVVDDAVVPEVDAGPAERSIVVARFTPEESEHLAGLFFPEPDEPPLADEAPRPTQADQYLALGRLLRSADKARETLAFMTPSEQLEACLVWSAEPGLRPIAFERLSELSMDPAVAGDVRRAAEDLSRDPAMRPWLTSFGFASLPARQGDS